VPQLPDSEAITKMLIATLLLAIPRIAKQVRLGLCYLLGGDTISVLSAVISLPADNNTDNSGPKEVLLGGGKEYDGASRNLNPQT